MQLHRPGGRAMDWFSAWEPVDYVDVERVSFRPDSGEVTAWLVLTVLVLAAATAWYRRRTVRRSFWCAAAGRDVEASYRRGRVLACSAFDDPSAVACARRCVDRGFRTQWASPLPVLLRPRSVGRPA